MVYLKRIELRGFKSFRGRTVLNLDKGLNVVTGPNGSGKSNLVDAVRFALGELNPRMLRVERFSALVYDRGGQGRRAYVKLVFDNSDRRIPFDSDQVEILRSVDVNGRVAYKVNSRRSSRTEVTDMLSAVGLSASGANIVMQGTVTRLADLSAKRRREIIEELIGISAYDEKKAKALEELRKAEVNLKVAEAKLEALREEVQRLVKEREDALRYIDLKTRIAKLQVTLLSAKIAKLEREAGELSETIETSRSELESIKSEREKLKALRNTLEDQLSSLPLQPIEAEELTSKLLEFREAKARVEEALNSLNRERERVEEDRRRLEERLKALEAELGGVKLELERASSEEEKVERRLEEKRDAYRNLVSNLKSRNLQLTGLLEETEKIHRNYLEAASIVYKLKSSIIDSKVKLNLTEREVSLLKEKLGKLEEASLLVGEQIKKLESIRSTWRGKLKDLLDTIQRRLSKLESLTARISSASTLASKARQIVAFLKAQVELADKIALNRDLKEKVEKLLVGEVQGVYGFLSDHIVLDEKYKVALEAAAGGLLDSLLVENLDVGLKCMEKLGKTDVGRLKIIPLREVREASKLDAPRVDGVIGVASEFVKSPEKFNPAVNLVFGRTLIAADRETALNLSKKGFRTVTVEGELYEPTGCFEYGSLAEPYLSQILSRSSYVKALNEMIGKLEKILEARSRGRKKLVEEVRRLRESYVEVEREILRIEADLSILKREEAKIRRQKEKISQRLNEVSEEAEKLKRRMGEDELEVRAAEERVALALKDLADLKSKFESAETDQTWDKHLINLLSEISAIEENLLSLKTEKASLESRVNLLLGREYSRLKSELAEVEEKLKRLRERRVSLEVRLRKIEEEIEKTEVKLKEKAVESDPQASSIKEKLSSVRSRLRETESKFEVLFEKLSRLEAEYKEKNTRIEVLREELRRLGFEKPIGVEGVDLGKIEEALARCEAELAALGSVNLLAVDRYEEVKPTYEEWARKVEVLRGERDSILRFIEEVEKEKRRVFEEFLEEVNSNLREVFRKLTGGGDAWLEPEVREDPFKGGLDLIAVFPGKPRRSIAIASGGEKTMAALAFIFALSKLNPSPIYLLDEVDAHLDPVNLERLSEALKDLSSETQFIVITLKDVVASKADRLYGVYLKGGVSRIVSLNLKPEARV